MDSGPIVTVMRVKDEEAYIEHALDSLRPVGGAVVLLDDGSTDRTPEIAQSFDFVDYHRQDDMPMDEGRDRTHLYRLALAKSPEWIFTLDGDEALAKGTGEAMLRAVEQCPDAVNVFEMYLAVMASAPGDANAKWFGIRGGAWSMDRMFRVRDAVPGYEFASNFGSNLHCGCVPEMRGRAKQKLNLAWIEYYGYETPEAVDKKREFYRTHDPVNFPNVEALWRRRAKCRPIRWVTQPDVREYGKSGTVTY